MQIGNCVTIPRLKLFLILLGIFPLTFLMGVAPIAALLASHVKRAILESQKDNITRRLWWDWAGSWVIVCGPAGRWIVGAILGFRLIQARRLHNMPTYPGEMIEEPSLTVIAVVFVLFAFALLAVVSRVILLVVLHAHTGCRASQ